MLTTWQACLSLHPSLLVVAEEVVKHTVTVAQPATDDIDNDTRADEGKLDDGELLADLSLGGPRKSLRFSSPSNSNTMPVLKHKSSLPSSIKQRLVNQSTISDSSPASRSSPFAHRSTTASSPQKVTTITKISPHAISAKDSRDSYSLSAIRDTDFIVCIHATKEVTVNGGSEMAASKSMFTPTKTSSLSASTKSPGDNIDETEDLSEPVKSDASLIRMLSLSNWKRACLSFVQEAREQGVDDLRADEVAENVAEEAYFQQLNVDIDFHAYQIEVNETGKLLAVAGKSSVMIIVLPLYSRYSGPKIEARSSLIGGLPLGVEVVKVKWHPLSTGSVHLAILCSDGSLRMYDTSRNLDEPETVAYFLDFENDDIFSESPSKLISKKNKQGMFGSDLEAKEPISFDFGAGVGWGPYTAYCMMKNGDIYSVCPFVPVRSSYDMLHLANLQALNTTFAVEKQPSDEYFKRQFYWRDTWLSEKLSATSDPSKVCSSTVSKLQPLIQGPHHALPSDPALFETNATDILVLPTKPVHVFAIAYSEGRVHLCLDLAPTSAMWDFKTIEPKKPYVPKLFIYECIDLRADVSKANNPVPLSKLLKGPSREEITFSPMTLRSNTKSPETLYAQDDWGVHSIFLGPCLASIEKALEAEYADIVGTRQPSDLRWLFDTRALQTSSLSSIIGCCVLEDVYMGQNVLAMTSSGRIQVRQLPLRIPEKPGTVQKPPSTATSKHYPWADLSPFQTMLPKQFEVPKVLASNASRQPVVITPASSSLDDASVRAFAGKAAEFRREMTEVEAAGMELRNRVEDIRSEFESQEKYCGKLSDAVSTKLLPKISAVQSHVQKLIRQQQSLQSRSESILQLLVDKSHPEISRQELEFFEELKKLSHRMKNYYVPLLLQLETQKNELLPQLDKLKADTARATYDSSEEPDEKTLAGVNDALIQEQHLVISTWKQFAKLRKEYEEYVKA